MNRKQKQKVLAYLVKNQFISKAQSMSIKTKAEQSSKALEEIIVEQGMINDEHLGQLISEINDWQYVNLRKKKVDAKVLMLIPEKVAKKQKVLALQKTEEGVQVAMTNPDNTALLHTLSKTLGTKILPYYATPVDLTHQFSLYNPKIASAFEKISKIEKNKKDSYVIQEDTAINIVNALLERGYESNASDVHIEPFDEYTLVRFRIDGMMQKIITIPKKAHELIISRIKVLSRLRTDEHLMPQDGKLSFKIFDKSVDVRVSIVPTTKGENAVMRISSGSAASFTLEKLGLPEKSLAKLKAGIERPWGMILATGPTGAGKTTMLYAILKVLNKETVNIATIEDPVENNVDGITQIQVNTKTNLTFGSGLRSIVRQDPDVIMVGEIRDHETAHIAVDSAMTGHLVLSTLHTNDAPTALPRLVDMEIEPFLVSSTVNIIIAQRLLRKICTKCIKSYDISAEKLKRILPPSVYPKIVQEGESEITLFKGIGCDNCNDSGYAGRVGVFEIMEVDNDIKKLIMQRSDSIKIRNQAIKNGMITMSDDAAGKVMSGITTIDEVIRVVK